MKGGEIKDAVGRIGHMGGDPKTGLSEWVAAKEIDEAEFQALLGQYGQAGSIIYSRLSEALMQKVNEIVEKGIEEGFSLKDVTDIELEAEKMMRDTLSAVAASSFRVGYTVAERRMGKEAVGE